MTLYHFNPINIKSLLFLTQSFFNCLTDSVFPHVFGQKQAADQCDQKSSSTYGHQQKSITHWKLETHRAWLLQERL